MALSDSEQCSELVLLLRRVEHKLDQLKVNTGGERLHKPQADEKQVICKVRCSVITVGQIDTVKQEFWAEVYLSLRWKEDEFIGKCKEDVDWGEYWDPEIYFLNAVNIDSQERWHDIIDNDQGSKDVKLSIRVRATFNTSMKLQWFPFDYQKLTIKLMSDRPKEFVKFEKDRDIKDHVQTETFTDEDEWILHKILIAEPIREKKGQTGSINEFDHYHISMYVQRKYGYYLWNIALIVILILLLSFACFSIPAEHAGERFGVSVSLLLTAVAYKYVVTSKLPLISYLTLLDRYSLWCLFIHALVVVQNALSISLVHLDEDTARIIDYASVAFLGCIVLTVILAFIREAVVKTKKTASKMKKLKEKYDKNWNDHQSPVTSNCYEINNTIV